MYTHLVKLTKCVSTVEAVFVMLMVCDSTPPTLLPPQMLFVE